MGSFLSNYFGQEQEECNGHPTAIGHIYGPKQNKNYGKRKRSGGSSINSADSATDLTDVAAAKRFKLSTLDYVYQKLFVEGLNSDVTIYALGNTWKLHRLYLEQCDYFRALFRGNWSDSGKNEYILEIDDENIDFKGLHNVFACLYNNEIEIDQEHIAGVCGAASMLSLTSVLDKCSMHLMDYVHDKNKLLLCLQLADRYGFEERLNEAYEYLKYMFFHFCRDENFLRGLSVQMFVKLLSADLFCVHENEFDFYMAIKNWIFLRECPTAQISDREANNCFFTANGKFLWRRYASILRHLRVPHLFALQKNFQMIADDQLIPEVLFNSVIKDQWHSLLISEESGEGFVDSIEDPVFYASCYRLGRTGVDPYSRVSWRWLGYFFGVDLLVNYDYGFLRLTRNQTVAPNHTSIKNLKRMPMSFHCLICTETGQLLLDTKRQTRIFTLDRSIEIGAIKLPEKSVALSIYLFYLPIRPIRPPAQYWDELNVRTLEEEIVK